ncbi:MAG: hypothetical protein IKD06_03840 [Clostridia bacterium]|nr:hypothetical protein [Clostridia bacterium]
MNPNDISSLLESFLSDPNALEKARGAAQALLGPPPEENGVAESAADGEPSPKEAAVAAKLISALSAPVQSQRIALLHALKPLVSPARAAKIDSACKLLKLAEMFSLFSDDILQAL